MNAILWVIAALLVWVISDLSVLAHEKLGESLDKLKTDHRNWNMIGFVLLVIAALEAQR